MLFINCDISCSIDNTETSNNPQLRSRRSLQIDLHTALGTTLLQSRQQIRDVVPRVTVQTGAQSLLVEVVRDQPDAAAEHEQSVQDTVAHVVLDFLARERAAVAHQIDETDRYTSVNVQDQVVLLRRRHCFHGDRVVQQLGVGEVLLGVLLDQLNTKVRIVARLDAVADTGDCSSVGLKSQKR